MAAILKLMPTKLPENATLADIDWDDEKARDEWFAREIRRGGQRVRENMDRLRAQGILNDDDSQVFPIFDQDGNIIEENLPPAMRADSPTDTDS